MTPKLKAAVISRRTIADFWLIVARRPATIRLCDRAKR
jgi:hypothetical protein